jgi:hypothetical protein
MKPLSSLPRKGDKDTHRNAGRFPEIGADTYT